MSILSGWLKTRAYRKTKDGYKKETRDTSSETVFMNDGNTAETNLGDIKGITDSLTATSSNVALSAKGGNSLQGQINTLNSNLNNKVDTTDSRLSNARPASDVYSWAKASSKPSYSWNEITEKPGIIYVEGNQYKSGSLTITGGVFAPFIQISDTGNFSIYSPALQCRNENNTAWVPCYALSYPSQSSKLIKKNIESMTDEEALKLLNLHVVTYDYINEENGTGCRGLIAEETIDIIPSCVTVPENYATTEEELNDNQTNTLGIDYSKLVPYLIKMIQIQQNEIDELKQLIKNK